MRAVTQTSSRLLRLLSLLQARREWPGSVLAERLETSGRTIRRDVGRLRDLGYPVEATSGPAGGYRLRAGSAMPPLLLDDDEAIAIAVGLGTAASFSRPMALLCDGAGHLYVADTGNSTVRVIDLATATVSTVLGIPGQAGVVTGPLPTTLNSPAGLALGPGPTLFISDRVENAILALH